MTGFVADGVLDRAVRAAHLDCLEPAPNAQDDGPHAARGLDHLEADGGFFFGHLRWIVFLRRRHSTFPAGRRIRSGREPRVWHLAIPLGFKRRGNTPRTRALGPWHA